MSLGRRTFIAGAAAALAAACARPRSQAPAPMPPKKKILILGGTGFLGPAIVDVARQAGHTLTLFNRGKTHPERFTDLEQLHGDRDGDLAVLGGRKWDVVIDTSAYLPAQVSRMLEAIGPSIEHYIMVSSISVYADPLKPHADESAPLQSGGDVTSRSPEFYGSNKAASEQAAEAALPGKVTIVRPGLIVGPGDPTDRFTYWPLRLARGGEVLAPGNGSSPWQIIDVRDLGAWLVHLAAARVLGTFNAVGPAEPSTFKVFLETMGPQAQLTWVDGKFLESQEVMPWMDLPVWTGDDPGFASIDGSKAIASGLTFRPLGETSRDTLAWWTAEPAERRNAPLRAGLSPDKEAAVLAAWKAR